MAPEDPSRRRGPVGRRLSHPALLIALFAISPPASRADIRSATSFVPRRGSTPPPSPQHRTAADPLLRLPRGGAREAAAVRPAKVNPKDAAKTADSKEVSTGGSSSSTQSVFNLVNNIAGAGILTLAAGKAAGTGWIPAAAICMALAFASCKTFILIGKACEITGQKDFKGLWSLTIGPNSTWIVDSATFLQCFCVSTVYSGILGDVWTPLLKFAGLPDRWNHRTSNIIILTAAVLFPLSLLKNLSALAFTSMLGAFAVLYTVLFVLVRGLDGSYSLAEPVGRFLADGAIIKPSFEKSTLWNLDFTSLILMSNLGLAFIAHYNGPTYYRELKDTNSKRFGNVSKLSYAIVALLYVITMSAGYNTFGDTCKGNIMLNYHPDDTLAILGRFATFFSILFGFPLTMRGAHEGLWKIAEAWGFPGVKDKHATVAAVLLTVVTSLAINVKDVSLIVGLAGAILGSFLVYICPPIIYTRAVKLVHGEESDVYKKERLYLAFIPMGGFIAAMGVYITLKDKVFGK